MRLAPGGGVETAGAVAKKSRLALDPSLAFVHRTRAPFPGLVLDTLNLDRLTTTVKVRDKQNRDNGLKMACRVS
jgi:hypothetical protein